MRNMRNDLRRAVFNRYFFIAAALVFLMYLQDGYEMLASGNTDVISLYLLVSTIGALHWLVPCVGAITFARCYVRDRDSLCCRYFHMRQGTWRYCLSKGVACFVSAGLATFLGITAFLLLACARLGYPSVSDSTLQSNLALANEFSLYSLLAQGRFALFLALRLSLTGICAGFWALVGLTICAYWRNIYVAIFSPVVIAYFKDYLYGWLGLQTTILLKDVEWCEYLIPGVLKGYGLCAS